MISPLNILAGTRGPPLRRILFCGDSITVGYDDIEPDPTLLNGFRPGTITNLFTAGHQVTWGCVGNNVGGTIITGGVYTNHYQAGSGATIQNQKDNLLNFFPRLVPRVDVMRVMLGTNNVAVDPLATTTNYTDLLNAFFLAFPSGAVSVGRVPPVVAPANPVVNNPIIAQMNVDIAAVVATFLAGGKPIVFEADAGLVAGDFASGGVHLIAPGNVKMAVVAAAGIAAALTLSGGLP